ncbi:MAG: RNA polymerase sigma factor [Desulfitobacteriaceae bacterium]
MLALIVLCIYIVKSYTPYVYRTVFALLQDRSEAEDVSQEVFLKIYRSIGQLSNPHAFHYWLNKIMTHTCLDRLKKQNPTPIADHWINIYLFRMLYSVLVVNIVKHWCSESGRDTVF